VSLRSHASLAAKSNHLSMVRQRTEDETPFHCKVHQEYELPEARGYCASFDEATKEEIEQLGDVSLASATAALFLI